MLRRMPKRMGCDTNPCHKGFRWAAMQGKHARLYPRLKAGAFGKEFDKPGLTGSKPGLGASFLTGVKVQR